MICIHQTDGKWYNQLKGQTDLPRIVFFPRGGSSGFTLEIGSYFYFKERGKDLILGRALYMGSEIMSTDEAWKCPEIQCGFQNEGSFNHLFKDNKTKKQIKYTQKIRCIKLIDIEWLETPIRIKVHKIDRQTYRKIDIDKLCKQLIKKKNQKKVAPTQSEKDQLQSEISELNKDMKEGRELIDRLDTEFCIPINTVYMESDQDTLDDNVYPEGARVLRVHKSIERNHRLIKDKKRDPWICEICRLEFPTRYGLKYIEAHHKIPLAGTLTEINKLDDIALLCANCHRAVHKKMAENKDRQYIAIKSEIEASIQVEFEALQAYILKKLRDKGEL
jgi:predicted HNH restriction endonuclease